MNKCFQCQKKFEGRKRKYCSIKCRDHHNYINNKKGNNHYLKKQRVRDKKYYYQGGKIKKRIYQKTKKFRDYQNKWRHDKKYWLEQYEKRPEVHRNKMKRYRKTYNGKMNTLKCNERRRKKILLLTGKYLEKLDSKFLINIRNRDKVCVYCSNEFNNNIHLRKETIDHFNCNEPLSEDNAVRCCWSCNSSKRDVPLEKIPEWIKRKKINPSPIVMELLNKKLKTISARSFS